MSEPLSTIVRAEPDGEQRVWILTCSLGHRTTMSYAELSLNGRRARGRRPTTCSTCRCLEQLMGQGDEGDEPLAFTRLSIPVAKKVLRNGDRLSVSYDLTFD